MISSHSNECICLSSDDDEDEIIENSPQVVFIKSSSRVIIASSPTTNGDNNNKFSSSSDRNIALPKPVNRDYPSQEDDVCMILSDDDEGTIMYTSPPKRNETNGTTNTINHSNDPTNKTSGFSTLLSSPVLFTKSSSNSSTIPFAEMGNNLLSDEEEEDQYKLPSPPISIHSEKRSFKENELSQPECSQTFSNHQTIFPSQSMEYSDSQSSSQYYESQSQTFGSCSQISFSPSRKQVFKKIAIGKFASTEIVTTFDENLKSSVGGDDIISDFTQNIASTDASLVNITKLPIAHSIQWKRRLALDYVLFVFQKQKRDPSHSIRYDPSNMESQTVEFYIPSVAIRMTGASFLKIYSASKDSDTNILHKYLNDVIQRR
nr:unnamed protein product [Naegleria fowleri]